MTAIEVIPSREMRRYWTRAEKTRCVLALNEPDANTSRVAPASALAFCIDGGSNWPLLTDRPAFVPVTVSAPAAERSSSEVSHGTMTIAFGASVRLTIEGAPDEATLSRVIGELARHDRRR